MTYKHKEAFCLMQYACDKCHRHVETFWNSRDGVTPFGLNCPSCGGVGTLRHINFAGDICNPDHKPHRGQKIWRDGTVEEALAIMDRRFKVLNAQVPPPGVKRLPDIDPQILERIKSEIRAGTGSEFPPGWPIMDVTL